jgi:hypothetical protein
MGAAAHGTLLSRSLAQVFLLVVRPQTFEHRERARHRKLAGLPVECLGNARHHIAVLYARKDVQLQVLLLACQSAIRIQHVLRRSVVPIAPKDADRLTEVLELVDIVEHLGPVAGVPAA